MNVKIVILISFFLIGCVSTVVDESKLEISRELIEIAFSKSGKKEAIDALVPEMLESVINDIPNLTDSEIQKVTELVTEEMDKFIPDVFEHMAHLYAENFFQSELEQLLEIFKTRDLNDVWPPQQARLAEKFYSTVPRINTQLGAYASSLGDQVRDRLLAKLEQEVDT